MQNTDLAQRDKKVRHIILVEGGFNLLVLLAKLMAGLSTGSLSILSDALHSLTDVANNIVALFVMRLAAIPADRNHPYGHRKFETLMVFVLASLLVILSVELALNAIWKDYTQVFSGTWEIGVMLVVLIINILVAAWQRYWARRLKSDILLADSSHTFADVFITVVVIVGWQLSAQGTIWLDRLCALAVAGLVMYLAYSLFKSAIPILVDGVAIPEEQLMQSILQVAGVREVRRVRSRWMGSVRAVDLVIAVDPFLSTEASHKITEEVERLLENQYQVLDTSIHVEPG